MNKLTQGLLVSVAACSIATTANAQEENNPISLSASVGYEYDSNLTVDAIDSNSEAGDSAITFDATANYDFVDSDDVGFSAGYNFYQTAHNEYDEFDMAIHGFNLDGRYTLDRIDLGTTYMFNTIRLGGEAFMNMHTVRPNIGYLMDNNKVYLIGSYEYQKHDFDSVGLQGRDATRHSVGAKSIFLLGGGNTATASYDWTDHNTHDPGYAYTGHTIDFALKLPVEMFDRETIFRTSYKFQSKDYQFASRRYTGGETRSDKRHTVSASWQVPIVMGIYGKAEIEYIGSNSNYTAVDYKETISTFSVGWEF
ncbi:MAG: hypothetical protein P8H03_01190 [Emcibacteraceae bacterium]|nr:hypothetical protein [Emcibacteraceae bacterium]